MIRIFKNGDIFTKLSYLICGLSNMVRGQIVKGLSFLLIEVAYFYYMATTGVKDLTKIGTLGTTQQGMVFDEKQGIMVMTQCLSYFLE